MSNILRIPPRRPPSTAAKMDLDVPQIMTINQLAAPSSEADFEDYLTDDEEVDEIIDDEPVHAPAPPPLSPRKLNGKGKAKAAPKDLTPSATPAPVEPPKPKPVPEIPPLPSRKPGETYIDQQRVEKIIKAHGDMLPPSKDAVFLISLAAEEFIKRLAHTGRDHAESDKRKGILQRDIASAANNLRHFSFLKAIPISDALQKHAQKENERTLIATELVPPSTAIGNGTSANSHKKRQPPLPKPQPPAKGKTRTSARQANGRGASSSASAPVPITSAPSRPKRAAAQKGRGSWSQADEAEAPECEDEGMDYPELSQEPTLVPMDVDTNGHWKTSPKAAFGSAGGRGGIMKGFGPGAYGKGGLGSSRSVSAAGHSSPTSRSRGSWGFPPEPPRNTGRTIYSDRTDEEARKAAVEAEEQLRYKRARQKIEQELMHEEVLEEDGCW
ncbi:hypothetical protein BU17DRAFT_67274 [Hysterangium stoloniferum]|nr:hypothetical protein BU17DRAFT_67274 [Hysterangium stoloniferum]